MAVAAGGSPPSEPQDGDPPAAVLLLAARAAFRHRRRLLAQVEEHQRAGVEAETVEVSQVLELPARRGGLRATAGEPDRRRAVPFGGTREDEAAPLANLRASRQTLPSAPALHLPRPADAGPGGPAEEPSRWSAPARPPLAFTRERSGVARVATARPLAADTRGHPAAVRAVSAAWIALRLRDRRLASDRTLVLGALCWDVAVLALYGLLLWLLPTLLFRDANGLSNGGMAFVLSCTLSDRIAEGALRTRRRNGVSRAAVGYGESPLAQTGVGLLPLRASRGRGLRRRAGGRGAELGRSECEGGAAGRVTVRAPPAS